jgi:hypothetical protein
MACADTSRIIQAATLTFILGIVTLK